jgi:hypothetical protein
VRSTRISTPLAALALTLALAGRGATQDFTGWIGGGAILPAGTIQTKYETGWYGTAGVGRRLDDRLSLRFDYGLSQERLVAHALEGAFVEGGHDAHAFELLLRYTVNPTGSAPIYFVGGPGLYRRTTEITRVSDYVPGPSVCDPWLAVCETGPVPVTEILGARTSNDLGWSLGVGVDVPFWEDGRFRFFAEARWRYVRGPEYGLPGEEPRRGSGHYFPLVIGLRY